MSLRLYLIEALKQYFTKYTYFLSLMPYAKHEAKAGITL